MSFIHIIGKHLMDEQKEMHYFCSCTHVIQGISSIRVLLLSCQVRTRDA